MRLSNEQVRKLQMSSNNLVNWLLQRKSMALREEPLHVVGMFGSMIARAQALYPTAAKKVGVSLPRFVAPADTKHAPVRALARGIAQHGDDLGNAIIYSSAATHEIIANWSDLDVLVIIKDEVFLSAKRLWKLREALLELEKHLYEFDPWQHHGMQFITEADLRFYPESFLPIAALRGSSSLLAASTISLFLRDSTEERRQYFLSTVRTLVMAANEGVLRHHPKGGVYLRNNYENRQNSFYQFKYFISVVLLLPSLFIGVMEKPIAKKESFTKIKDFFEPKQLEFLSSCENVRLLFNDIKPRGNAIPAEVEQILGRQYFERAARFAVQLKVAYEAHQSAAKKK